MTSTSPELPATPDLPAATGGDPQYDHSMHGIHSAAAPRQDEIRRACEAHLRSFLGDDFEVLTEHVSTGIHLDLYVWKPTEARPFVTIVTAGMSDVPTSASSGRESDIRTELMLAVPADWPGIDPLDGEILKDPANFWPIKLLKDVARIPTTYDSFVTWGHTIADPNGDLFAPGLPFAGALVGPPLGFPPRIMRAAAGDVEIDYLAVFPATAEELAFRTATPGGGDALVDRFMEAGCSAVIDPSRASVVSGPPPWSVHALLTSEPEHLGEVLDEFLPNLAASLAQEGAVEHVMAAPEEEVRWRVSGPITPQQLTDDAAGNALRPAANPALLDHRGVVTITPERDAGGAPVVAVMAMAKMLAERSDVCGFWLPQQHHVTTRAEFLQDIKEGVPLAFRVHPAPMPDGSVAVITRGLAAIGGSEVLLRDSGGETHKDLARQVTSALRKSGDDPCVAPSAGAALKYGFSKFELVASVHPGTQEPVLEMVRVKKKGLFGR